MKTTIYCYSATGNTFRVAQIIARELGDCEILPCAPTAEHPDGGRVGFMFPVFFIGLPRAMEAMMRSFPFREGTDYFAVATYGGTPINAMPAVRDILREGGADLRYAATVRSVANYIMKYDVKASQKTLDAADSAARTIAKEIGAGVRRGPGIRVPIPSFRYPEPDSDRAFIVNRKACNGCATCVRVCPVRNIELADGHPAWKGGCDQCAACIHWCPVQAIDYGVRTVGRNRYHHPAVEAGDLPR